MLALALGQDLKVMMAALAHTVGRPGHESPSPLPTMRPMLLRLWLMTMMILTTTMARHKPLR